MYPSAEAEAQWFQRQNLTKTEGHGSHDRDLSGEVVAYLLVTLAVRPDRLPDGAIALLASRYLGHCVGEPTVH